MTTNIVTAKFNNTRRATTRPITQYDYGQILRIEGIELPATYEVDFSNNEHTGDSKPQLGSASGVHIPEEYIKTGKDIYAFVYLHAGAEDGETFYWIKIPNELRPMRTSEEPTPEEQSVITETIAALNAGVHTVEEIAGGMDAQIETALQEAKDSGEFDGKDGVSPEISVEEIEGGHRVTIVGAEGSSSFDIMDGADGRWIVSVAKTGSAGLVDTYTITYSDGTTTTFTVVNGKDGEDGISPIATVSQTSMGARIAITDKHGTTTADIENGTDGVSPTATVTQTATGAMISVTDAEGTTTAEISNGQPGTPGDDGISPTVTVTDITGGHRITITDAEGAHSFDVMDGDVAEAPVQDVQVNGTSVLDAQGVANVPVATSSSVGVVRASADRGTTITLGNILGISPATDAQIKAGTNAYSPIAPGKQKQSAFYGLASAAGDTTQSRSSNAVGNYTNTAKEKIQSMLGISQMLAPTNPNLVATQDYSTGDVFAANGHLYKATAAIAQDEVIIPDTNCVETTMVDAGGKIKDVQVNGTSIVQNGVANVPVASATELGTVKVSTGLAINSGGNLYVRSATDAYIKAGTNSQTYISPSKQDTAAFYGLAKAAGDSTQSSSSNTVGNYTDAAKSAISQMLNGSVAVTGTTPTITALPGIRYICGEVLTLNITLPASGIVDVVFESGSTPTVLTITPPTGQTVKWANGFDPTTLETNTTYEINIADGLGVAGAWS